MSTENNNKQTLFRFVSFRNPNLAETKTTNLAFIQRPDKINGVFDQVSASETQTKLRAMLIEASVFETSAIKTVEELEQGELKELVRIGKSLSANNELSPADKDLCKEQYGNLIDSETIIMIWDNLIYQYLTQTDFYIKEALTYILKALHIGYVQTLTPNEELKKINGADLIQAALNATIIIPSSVLGKVKPSSAKRLSAKELSSKEESLLTLGLEGFEKEQDALIERDSLKQLKSEVESIKNKYWSNYENALKAAREAYKKDYGEIIQAYEEQEDFIDDLEEAKAPEEDIIKAYEVLDGYSYPEFDFSYKDELDWNDIQSQLSEESLAYFLENFANAEQSIDKEVDLEKAVIVTDKGSEITVDTNTFSFRHNGFDEIISDIDNQVDTYDTISLNEANLPQDEYVNVGGAVVPVSTSTTTQTPNLSYVLRARKQGFFGLNRGYATFQIHVENSSWALSNAVISATTSSGAYTKNISAVSVVNNKINFPRFLRNNIRSISNLSVQVFFANGREAKLDLSTVVVDRPYTGVLTLKPVITDNPDNTNPSEPTPTRGEHFGLKRLGVAEYMKVTQSVHAYVPGEVSNIENVMASELRHKSINELTRTEDTITTSTSQEIEEVSDTTKVNRAEMQTEVAKELSKQRSFQSHANFSYDTDVYKFDTGVGFASTNAQHVSNVQAVAKSQEVTERAMERVQSKISEERISKIIQEVSLTNVHEYDNRGGLGENAERPKHITGVYRWVDKKMKNQIYNYGKRTMFEFMIPEPAKLHRLAIATTGHTLTAPVDPRKAPAPHKMSNATTASKSLLLYWADVYGVELTAEPQNKQQLIKVNGSPRAKHNWNFSSEPLQIDEGYVAKSGVIRWMFSKEEHRRGRNGRRRPFSIQISNLKGSTLNFSAHRSSRSKSGNNTVSGLNVSDNFTYTASGRNVKSFEVNLELNCEPSLALINAWKLENFNAIIEAYQTALDAHKEEVAAIEAEQAAKAAEQKDTMGNFYRIIESDVLKHNCIAYLLQNYLSDLGQDFTDGDEMQNFKVNLSDDLDKYTAKAKFLEQAFEWSIKDYTFYPYFWADRKEWQEMYLSENTDTLFRSFLQAGLARVIVTVKPGFEEAVQYFLETGDVWMGGETPIIGDPLYMSITQEMQEPTGVPQGNYWITRIPTTLTILQAKSAGLEVEQALPIFPEDEPENCENPEQLETVTSFTLDDVQLTSPSVSETTLYSN
ncbi:hypothetical protein [uncultured Psychroserpens sp.]|uniref:hypothetical protein n=1 Tax=uncultured Psychroserpens sp. TaxID=255436 RepID=UPI00261084B0|nr:hypothetical protein [uncultured Psychroserpens sp.]